MAFEMNDQIKELKKLISKQRQYLNTLRKEINKFTAHMIAVEGTHYYMSDILKSLQDGSLEYESKTIVEAKSDPTIRNRPQDCIIERARQTGTVFIPLNEKEREEIEREELAERKAQREWERARERTWTRPDIMFAVNLESDDG